MDSFSKIAENKILEAIRDGVFDHLEGFGQPIDHSDYFNAPEDLRLAYHILKNAGIPPEEVQMMNSIYQITKKLKNDLTRDERERLEREKVMVQTRLMMLKESKKNW
ncbi:MAG: hypothetical protein AMS27_10555 [Bacteroides sp. SM23_62_1]|nr:MAG: hypothetical protein AMS27_10555 [Bacteroides sp. SM23_62_1]